MTIRGRHRLAASVLLAAMGTACGGGGAENSNASRARETRPSRATSTMATSGPPVDAEPTNRVSPPTVVDRGRDHVAIARSLLLYARWIAWHQPDPALIERAYAIGSTPARVASSHVTELRRIGAHIVEIDTAPFDLAIISRSPNVVSLRLTEYLAHRELIAASGRVLERDRSRTEQYLVSILRAASNAPWRLNLVERRPPKIEVQL